jgi:hypothetical protein
VIQLVSPVAEKFTRFREWPDRTAPVFGVCAHTTGSSIVEKANHVGVNVLRYVASYYLDEAEYAPSYVIGWDGSIIQLSEDSEKTPHVGFAAAERLAYLSGAWKALVSSETLQRWLARWPGVKSPAHLFPGPSPNNVYLGVEMPPLLKSGADGLNFSPEQHRSFAKLALDIGKRHGFSPLDFARMVGHEDVAPLNRQDKRGGWDPGALRRIPAFDWRFVRSCTEGLADTAIA